MKDFEWFLEHYNDIYQQYGECYVAIKDQCILGVYSSFLAGITETEKTEERGTFIVQHCTGDATGYTEYIVSPGLIQ